MEPRDTQNVNYAKNALAQSGLIQLNPSSKHSIGKQPTTAHSKYEKRPSALSREIIPEQVSTGHDTSSTTARDAESEIRETPLALITPKTSSPEPLDTIPGQNDCSLLPPTESKSVQNSNNSNNNIAGEQQPRHQHYHDDNSTIGGIWSGYSSPALTAHDVQNLPQKLTATIFPPPVTSMSSTLFSSSPPIPTTTKSTIADCVAISSQSYAEDAALNKHRSTSFSTTCASGLQQVKSTASTLASDISPDDPSELQAALSSKPLPPQNNRTSSIFAMPTRKPLTDLADTRNHHQHHHNPNQATNPPVPAATADIKVNQDSPWPTAPPKLDPSYRDHSKTGGGIGAGRNIAAHHHHHQKNQASSSSSIFDSAQQQQTANATDSHGSGRNPSAEFTLSTSSSLHTHASHGTLPKSRDSSPCVPPSVDFFTSTNSASIFDTLSPGNRSKRESIFDAEVQHESDTDTKGREGGEYDSFLFQSSGFLESSMQPPAPRNLARVDDSVLTEPDPLSSRSTLIRSNSSNRYEMPPTGALTRAHDVTGAVHVSAAMGLFDRHSSQNYSTTNTQLSSSHEIETSRENLFIPAAHEANQKQPSKPDNRRHTASPYATIFDPGQLGNASSWDGNHRPASSNGTTPIISPDPRSERAVRETPGLLTTQPNMFAQKMLNSAGQQSYQGGPSKHHQNQDDWPKFPSDRAERFNHELDPQYINPDRQMYSLDEMYKIAKKKVCSALPKSGTIDFSNKKYLCPRNDKWDPRLYMHAERLRRFPELVERERLAKEKRAVSRQLSEAIKNAQKDSAEAERRIDPIPTVNTASEATQKRHEERARESPNLRLRDTGRREPAPERIVTGGTSASVREPAQRGQPSARGGYQHGPSELILRACRERSQRAKEKSGDQPATGAMVADKVVPTFSTQPSCESVLASDAEVAGYLATTTPASQAPAASPEFDGPQTVGTVPSTGGPAGVTYQGPPNRRPGQNDDRGQKRGIFDFGNKRDVSRGNACFDDWKGARSRKWREIENEERDGDGPDEEQKKAPVEEEPQQRVSTEEPQLPETPPVVTPVDVAATKVIPAAANIPAPAKKAFDFAEEIRRRKMNAAEKEREKSGPECAGSTVVVGGEGLRMDGGGRESDELCERPATPPKKKNSDTPSTPCVPKKPSVPEKSPVDSAILKIETSKRDKRNKKSDKLPEWALNDDDVNTHMALVGMPDDFRSIDPAIRQSSRRLNTNQRQTLSRNASSETEQIQGTWLDEKLRAGSRNRAHQDAIDRASPAPKPRVPQLDQVFKRHVNSTLIKSKQELDANAEAVHMARRTHLDQGREGPPREGPRDGRGEREARGQREGREMDPREAYYLAERTHYRDHARDPREHYYDARDGYGYGAYEMPPHLHPHYYTEEIYRERRHQVRHVHPADGWMDKRGGAGGGYPGPFPGAPWEHTQRSGSPRDRMAQCSGDRERLPPRHQHEPRHPEERHALDEVNRAQEKLRLKRGVQTSGETQLRPEERVPRQDEQRPAQSFNPRRPPQSAGYPPASAAGWEDAPPAEYWEYMYTHYPEEYEERMHFERHLAAWEEGGENYPPQPPQQKPSRHQSGGQLPTVHMTPIHQRHPSKEGVNLILAQLNKPSSERESFEAAQHAQWLWEKDADRPSLGDSSRVAYASGPEEKPRMHPLEQAKEHTDDTSLHPKRPGEQNPVQHLFDESPEIREKRPSGPRQNLSNWEGLKGKEVAEKETPVVTKPTENKHGRDKETRLAMARGGREDHRGDIIYRGAREEFRGNSHGEYGQRGYPPEYYEDPREYYEGRRGSKYGHMPGHHMPRHGAHAGYGMPEYGMYEDYAEGYDYAYHTRYHHPGPPRGGHYAPEWHGEQRSPRGNFGGGGAEGRYRGGAGPFQGGPPPEAYREGGEAWTHDERSHREGWSSWATAPAAGKGNRW